MSPQQAQPLPGSTLQTGCRLLGMWQASRQQWLNTRELSCQGAAACAQPVLLSGKCCPWFFSCRELSQATSTIFGAFLVRCCFLVWEISLNDRIDGTKNLLRDKPLCPSAAGMASAAAARAAGQNSCLLKQEQRGLCIPPASAINNWQRPGLNTAAFVLLTTA